jgi:hypothetical protein
MPTQILKRKLRNIINSWLCKIYWFQNMLVSEPKYDTNSVSLKTFVLNKTRIIFMQSADT